MHWLAGLWRGTGRFKETKEHIIPLLEDRLQDSEQAVRQHLAGQLEGLAKVKPSRESSCVWTTQNVVLMSENTCDVG